MERYIDAWNTNDPDAIGALFTEDATYLPTPFSDGWHGREAIVAGWLDRKDDAGTFEFAWAVLAENDAVAVVRGLTTYEAPYPTYSNIWVIEFDGSGACHAFTEWWMERPGAEGAELES